MHREFMRFNLVRARREKKPSVILSVGGSADEAQ